LDSNPFSILVASFQDILKLHSNRVGTAIRSSTLEEIGNRATVFSLEGTQSENREFIHWLLAERLATPLQIEQHLTLALEEAFQIGGKPVTLEVVESVLCKDINEMEPTLTRHSYTPRVVADLLNVHVAEVKKFLRGQLAPGRTQELQSQMLKAGILL
jgi:hypothetical protein